MFQIVREHLRTVPSAIALIALSACSGGGGSGGGGLPLPSPGASASPAATPSSGATASPKPTASPTPVPSATPTPSSSGAPLAADFACPPNDTTSSVARMSSFVTRRAVARWSGASEATLTGQRGTQSGTLGGERRYPMTVTQPYFPNNPYFNGFATTSNENGLASPAPGALPAATYHVSPYDESATVPGQWDMHAIALENAFAYSQAGSGSKVFNANALGSSSVKIAIIDTGEDPNHLSLKSKIAYQRCFITNPTTNSQSTSNFSEDPSGHGTDVAGLAAAALNLNPALGFAGAGGNVEIYAYRVYPTPQDVCVQSNGATPPPTATECSADTADIASAINDAVSQGVNVINMSFGGAPCTTAGVDPDSKYEGPAISKAITANVIVIAAAGNDGNGKVDSPACDSGVIAVGASALGDGQQNGTGLGVGSASNPTEYVPSYSNYGTPGAALKSSSAWGIVAPGGDPQSGNDVDALHWIFDIWTTTPVDSNFAGYCSADYPNMTASGSDCTSYVGGTSMSAPHVAGAAALILSVNGSNYQSPAKMKQLLCSTADDIGSSYNEGCGRLNVYRAMATAMSDPTLP